MIRNFAISKKIYNRTFFTSWKRSYTSPTYLCEYSSAAYDVLINDVMDENLKFIAEKVGTEYLSATTMLPFFPVRGVLWNAKTNRTFVNLVVQRNKDIKVNVLFMIDTGCPDVYLRKDTLAALGYNDSIPSSLTLNIHGTDDIFCEISRAHFSNVNVLGMSYFVVSKNLLSVDAHEKTATIDIRKPAN